MKNNSSMLFGKKEKSLKNVVKQRIIPLRNDKNIIFRHFPPRKISVAIFSVVWYTNIAKQYFT